MSINRVALDFPVNSAPQILVTRLSHLGDCVLTLPLVEALKQHWPNCRISWAMESPGPKLLAHHPAIDRIVQIPRNYLKSPQQIWNLRRQLRAARIDIVLDPQSLTKSAMLGWLSGAPYRIGFGGRYGKELSTWLNNYRVVPDEETTHLVDRSLRLVDFVAGKEPRPGVERTLHLPLTNEGTQWLAAQQLSGTVPQRYVVLNPGASWPSKRWENSRWAEVAAQLVHDGTSVVVTWAGAEERAWAEEIVAEGGEGVFLAPDTTLPQLAALCHGSEYFLGCDTGPMHIAAAVGKRCVVLFGPTRPEDSGPYGAGHVCLQAWHQTEPSGQKKTADNRAMRDIEAHQVLQAIDGLSEVRVSLAR
jgi:heptosyltransferase-1